MSTEQILEKPQPFRSLRTPRRAVAAMFLLNGALLGIWASRVPAIVEMHHLSEFELGVLLLFMFAGSIVSFPFAGRLSDKYGSALVTKRIAFAYGGTLVALALAPGIWTLALGLFLFGAAHGSMDVTMNAWAGEVERHVNKPIMSSFHAMWSLGAGLGSLSGYLAVNLEAAPSLHFLVGAAIAIALTLPLGLLHWPFQPPKATAKTNGSLIPIPRGPLAFVGIIGFCSALGEGAMADWSAIFLVQVVQADEGIAALGFAAFQTVMVIMRLLGGVIIPRLGAVNAARMSGVAVAIGTSLAIGFANLPVILVGFALMGFGYAFIFPLIFSRAANDDDLPAGAAIASVATFGYGGVLLGPVVIGFLAEVFFIRWAFLLLTLLAVVIVLLAHHLGYAGKSRAS